MHPHTTHVQILTGHKTQLQHVEMYGSVILGVVYNKVTGDRNEPLLPYVTILKLRSLLDETHILKTRLSPPPPTHSSSSSPQQQQFHLTTNQNDHSRPHPSAKPTADHTPHPGKGKIPVRRWDKVYLHGSSTEFLGWTQVPLETSHNPWCHTIASPWRHTCRRSSCSLGSPGPPGPAGAASPLSSLG